MPTACVRPAVPYGLFYRWISVFLFCAAISSAPSPAAGRQDPSVLLTTPAVVDARQPVADTTRFPFSAVGRVEGGGCSGTGVMIGRHLALTCAHVVAPGIDGGFDGLVFVPGRNGSVEPFGRVPVVKVIFCPQWLATECPNYDLAMLVLATPVGDLTGYLPIAIESDAIFDYMPVMSAGYPVDLGGTQQYRVEGSCEGMQGNQILHDLESEPGQSGSPLWYGGTGWSARMVGVVSAGYGNGAADPDGVRGAAVRIDASVADWVRRQRDEVNDAGAGLTGTGRMPGDFGGMTCGAGSGQALLASGLLWIGCAFVRRRV